MRRLSAAAAMFIALAAVTGTAQAASRQYSQDPVERTASGTPILPTRTIIHNPNGSTTVIVVPRRRSYLETGTEVSPGDRHFTDYVFPPGGDPGHQNWFIGPDLTGTGGYPLPRPLYIPGFNPALPY
ncbi:MAG: hypothetical protein JO134_09445 [Xanthobacteraceae bacterium]|nr:hypothetical protein [Xanthobacteraceae bacterium]